MIIQQVKLNLKRKRKNKKIEIMTYKMKGSSFYGKPKSKSPLKMNTPLKGFFGDLVGKAKDIVGGKGVAGALVNPIGAIASKGKGIFKKIGKDPKPSQY